MARWITITDTASYDIDEIMREKNCDEATACEIAYDFFNERDHSYEIEED